MRYQSALVLSTIAIGQAVATDARHAHFHRRNAQEKRNAHDVDWKRVANDVYGMDQKDWDTLLNWSTVNYGGSSAAAAPASTPAAAYTPAPAPASPTTTSTKAAETEEASSSSSAQESKATQSSSSSSGSSGSLSKFAKLGVFSGVGLNKVDANDENMWLGDDGKYKMTFVNDGSSDAALIGWGASTMWINAATPDIFHFLGAGDSLTVSIPYGKSGGFGVAFSDSVLVDGLLNESILEFTAKEGADGCFDVSREINMKGIVMTAVGSKCTSGVKDGQLACTFVCTSGQKCGAGGGDFKLDLGAATLGPCMVGHDPITKDPSGGCQMGDGEHVKVTIQDSRSWPS